VTTDSGMNRMRTLGLAVATAGALLLFAAQGSAQDLPPALDAWLQANQLGPYYAEDQDWDAIEAAAMVEGHVVVYSSSSRIDLAADHFMQLYPGITVEAYPLGSAQTLERSIRELEAGVFSVDVITTGGSADLKYELLERNYLFNFVPSVFAHEIPEEYAWPLLWRVGEARAAHYNTGAHPDGPPVSSYWDYTRPEYRGNIVMADPLRSATVFLQLATVVQQHEFMAADYERVFGEPLTLSPGVENAGYEWLYRLLQNDPVIIDSSTRLREVVGAPGQANPPLTLDSLTSLRFNELSGFEIGVVEAIPGVIYPTYMGIARQAPHPNAAKLFIRYLLGPDDLTQVSSAELEEPYTEGRSLDLLGGLAPWYDPGAFSPRQGAPLHPLAEHLWDTMTFWVEDGDFIWDEGPRLMDFWIIHQ
jgi:iron(III) transport system substrate-binding protein